MSKHTPKPWFEDAGYIVTHRVDDDGSRDCVILAEMHSTFGPDDYGVHQWMLPPEEYRANACLIAAAPEMYELLTRVATSTNSGYGSMMSAAALADTLRDLSSQAKQLMAKIEGGGE